MERLGLSDEEREEHAQEVENEREHFSEVDVVCVGKPSRNHMILDNMLFVHVIT